MLDPTNHAMFSETMSKANAEPSAAGPTIPDIYALRDGISIIIRTPAIVV